MTTRQDCGRPLAVVVFGIGSFRATGSPDLGEELNRFLRSHRVVTTQETLRAVDAPERAERLAAGLNFPTHTYALWNGNVIYSKGNDHIIDAVRCAMLAREQGRLDEVREEMVSLVPVVTNRIFV